MRKNLLKPLSLGLITTIASMQLNAQNVPIDWEPSGNGATWTWNVFENAGNAPVSIVANPSATGINTTANVMCMTALQTGQPYAGVECAHGNIGSFTLSTSNAIVKVMVYKSVISDVGVKFAIPSGGALVELKQPNTLINQWEELTFDFSGRIGDPNTISMDQIILFPDFNARTSDNICYFDNITFSAVTAPTTPTMGAPLPTAAQADVISMYSNTYTNIAMSTFATGWSAVAASDVVIAGNDTKLYSNLNFVGIEPVAQIDATAMNTFNIDVWTPNSTAFRVKLVDFGPNGIYQGGDDVEHEVTLTPTIGGWNSYHIPLSNFTNLTTKANIAQLILSSNPAGSSTVYADNIYFSNVAPTVPLVGAPVPTAAPANVISMFSNTYTNVAMSTFATGWSAVAASDVVIAGNDTKLYSNLDFVGIEPAAQINATAMNTFNIDVWTPNSTAFRVKLVDFGPNGIYQGGDDVEHEVTLTPTMGGWNSYHIPLSNFTNLTTKANIAQLILSSNPSGTSTVYADNMYFSYEPPLVPMVAAPTPTVAAVDVISMFSNAYTDVTVDTWRTPWSNATLTDLNIAGNPTKRYSALDFVGIETVGANLIDASTMTHFNIDVWTPNMTAFRVKLVDWGANGVWNGGGVDDTEHEIILTPTLSGWNTYSLPFTDFTNLANRENISQLILSGLPAGLGDVYVDNIYFSKVTAPLSINILDFTATVNNNTVSLNWNTTTEENLVNYEVERSTNFGASFTSIATLTAKKEVTNSYAATDVLFADKALYRLKLTDVNNAITYSNAVLVKRNGTTQDISVSPNPTSNSIVINSNIKIGTITIVNSFGQTIFETVSNNNTLSLDVSAFAAGTYFVKSKNGSLTKFTKN
jgi:hypothetical protein